MFVIALVHARPGETPVTTSITSERKAVEDPSQLLCYNLFLSMPAYFNNTFVVLK